jgi:hypothetical protein
MQFGGARTSSHAPVHRLDEPTGMSLGMVASPQCPLPFRPAKSGSAAIRFVDYMLGLAAVLILHFRLTGAIRFIHHAAPLAAILPLFLRGVQTSDPARLESPADARRACPLE